MAAAPFLLLVAASPGWLDECEKLAGGDRWCIPTFGAVELVASGVVADY
jgi:hypothetical protein